MMNDLVSIIMPVYNAERYLSTSIKSVITQTYTNWELVIVNDGSTDNSREIIESFSDNRIVYMEQENRGVSSARNLALTKIKGQYFCFLDADDLFTSVSLESRIKVFNESPDIDFVDGAVQYVNEELNFLGRKYIPDFKGYPFERLLRMNSECMFGNTWMIKKDAEINYSFQEDMTHAEDLFFYLTISKSKKYSFTKEVILNYRQHEKSAMKDLKGLEEGYKRLLQKVSEFFPEEYTMYIKYRIIRVMFLSWLIDGKRPIKAILSVFKFMNQ
ncbi:glycosyltransferase family 2 protein [Marinoscillum sp.]|uniref:glycosyltransferase family 2 protein n=1 Tax=Marinoscillum sp. TaxID=2024838 RepID=UPI003BAB4307